MAESGPGSPPSVRRQLCSLAVAKFKEFKGRREKRKYIMLEKRTKRMC